MHFQGGARGRPRISDPGQSFRGMTPWGHRMGRGMFSDPQKKFQTDRPSIFLLLDPKSGRLPDSEGLCVALGGSGGL